LLLLLPPLLLAAAVVCRRSRSPAMVALNFGFKLIASE
jgi:hypothetical protein